MPTRVVKRPIFFDLVQPKSPISMHKKTIPKRKDMALIWLDISNVMGERFLGYPLVVIITSFVIPKTDTRKQLAVRIVTLKMRLWILLSVLSVSRLATIAIEKPAKREATSISWFTTLFRYSGSISMENSF